MKRRTKTLDALKRVCRFRRSQEARGERGVAGGGQLHLPRHRVPAALAAGEGVGRRPAPHGRGQGEEHARTHTQ